MRHQTLLVRQLGPTLLGILITALAPVAQAFEQGQSSVALAIGSGQQLGRDYTVINARYGYFFVKEFEASMALELWRGSSPEIYKIVPELRYVYSASQTWKPYGALFVGYTTYGGAVQDRSSYGAKAGVYLRLNPSAHLGLGLVHERMENCDTAVYRNCQYTYPQASLNFTF
jgi:hypothetical protein